MTLPYTGWLHDSTKPSAKGTQFDSGSIGPFVLGSGPRDPRLGSGHRRHACRRTARLVIPPELAYGNNSPDTTKIPQNATLVFDVTLNAVQ